MDVQLKVSIENTKITSFLEGVRTQFTKLKIANKDATDSMKSNFKEMDALVDDFEKSINIAAKSSEKLADSGKKTGESMKSMRTQVKEATQAAYEMERRFGAGSQQFKDAAKNAANLKDRMQVMQRTFSALNPVEKFRPLVNVLQGAVGGFQALTAAQGLFGNESDDVQKALLKVQQLMLFGQGINSILALKDEWQNLKIALGLVTVAQQAQAVAATEVAVATTAEAAATTGATVATNAFTAALLANPFTAILVGLAAIVAGLFAYQAATEDAAQDTQKMIDKLNELADVELGAIENKRKLNDAAAANQISKEEGNAEKILAITKAKNARTAQLLEEEKQQRLTHIDQLHQLVAGAEEEDKKQLEEQIKSEIKALDNLAIEKALMQFKDEEAILAYNKSVKEKRNKELEDYKNHLKELEDLTKTARAKLTQMEIDNAADAGKLQLIQAQREVEINELESHFERLNKILGKGYDLSPTQRILLAKMRLEADKKAFKEDEDLQRAHTQAKLVLIKDEQEKELAAYELNFNTTAEALRQAGVSQNEIVELLEKGKSDIKDKYREQDLAKLEKYENDMLILNTEFVANDIDIERQLAIEKINIHKKYLEVRLAAAMVANDADTEAGQQLIISLKAQVKQADNEISKLQSTANKAQLTWAKIFGFTGENADIINAGIDSLMNSAVSIGDTILSEQDRILQAQIQGNQEYINELSNRVNATESALNRELDLQRQGYASNVSAKQKELRQLKAEQQKAFAEQKRLSEEKKKLQKEEVIVDNIAAAAKIILSIAQLFAAESTKGIPGIIAASAGAVAIIANIIALKAKIKQVEMREGGTIEFGKISGRSHERGGNRIEGTNITVENGEYLNSAKSTSKYGNLLDGINRNRLNNNAMAELRSLLNNTGVVLNSDAVNDVKRQKETVANYEAKFMVSNEGVEKRINEIHETVKGMKRQKTTEVLSDGTIKIQTGIKTTYIR